MARQAFSDWLLEQTHRDEPIGDLAKDYRDDRRIHGKLSKEPYTDWKTLTQAKSRLSKMNAPEIVRETLNKAWEEYRQSWKQKKTEA